MEFYKYDEDFFEKFRMGPADRLIHFKDIGRVTGMDLL